MVHHCGRPTTHSVVLSAVLALTTLVVAACSRSPTAPDSGTAGVPSPSTSTGPCSPTAGPSQQTTDGIIASSLPDTVSPHVHVRILSVNGQDPKAGEPQARDSVVVEVQVQTDSAAPPIDHVWLDVRAPAQGLPRVGAASLGLSTPIQPGETRSVDVVSYTAPAGRVLYRPVVLDGAKAGATLFAGDSVWVQVSQADTTGPSLAVQPADSTVYADSLADYTLSFSATDARALYAWRVAFYPERTNDTERAYSNLSSTGPVRSVQQKLPGEPSDFFGNRIPLRRGDNTVVVTAWDAAFNVTADTIHLCYAPAG